MNVKKPKIRTYLINIYIKTRNISKEEFCQSCEISVKLLNRILNGSGKVSIKTIKKIAEPMGLRLHQMFDEI